MGDTERYLARLAQEQALLAEQGITAFVDPALVAPQECVDRVAAGGAGECYACIVGVATGPESHSLSCPARNQPERERVTHVIETTEDEENDERSCWECSCGHGGSGPTYKIDELSDVHIPPGDHRVDRYPARRD